MAGWRNGESCLICAQTTRPHLALGVCDRCYVRVKNSVRRRAQFPKTTWHSLGLARLAVVRGADGAVAYILTQFAARREAEALALLGRMVPLGAGERLDAVAWDAIRPIGPQAGAVRRGRDDYQAGRLPTACPYAARGNAAVFARRWHEGYRAAQEGANR